MKLLIKFALSLVLLSTFQSCDILNPKEELPIYVKISNPRVLVDEDKGYYSSLGIKDVHFSQGPNFLGVYELPRVIAVYPKANKQFTLEPGIFKNGFSSSRIAYPLWKPLVLNIDVEPLDTFRIEPVFTYYKRDSFLIYPFVEDFEDPSIKFMNSTAGTELATMTIYAQDKHEGDYAGRVQFNATEKNFKQESAISFDLPLPNAAPMFLEITYKSDFLLNVGMIAEDNGFRTEKPSGITFNKSNEWKTVYLRLNEVIEGTGGSPRWRIYLAASGNGETGTLLLDNLRVVYRRPDV